MPKYSTESIRTVALVGHTGAGKTTLAEALLAKAGAIPSAGSVERGNTVCDFDPLEKEYRHSLNSAIVNFAWKNTHIHLIDTPASPDKALGAGHLIPLCFTSAKNGVGIEALLDILVSLAPNATEGNAPPFLKGEGEKAEEFFAVPGAKAHVLAHVFKIVMDPFI